MPFGLLVSVPYFFAKWVNSKIKIVDTFITSVFFASVMGAGILFFATTMVLAAIYIPFGAIYMFIILNLGLLFKRFRYLYKDELNKIKFKGLNLETRLTILDQIQDMDRAFENLKRKYDTV